MYKQCTDIEINVEILTNFIFGLRKFFCSVLLKRVGRVLMTIPGARPAFIQFFRAR